MLRISGCPPILDNPGQFIPAKNAQICNASVSAIKDSILSSKRVIIGTSWDFYLKNDQFEESLINTLKTLQDKNIDILLLGDIPRAPNLDQDCQLKTLKKTLNSCLKNQKSLKISNTSLKANYRIEQIAKKLKIPYSDFNHLLCDNKFCFNTIKKQPIYFDTGHLNTKGSLLLADLVNQHPEKHKNLITWMKQ